MECWSESGDDLLMGSQQTSVWSENRTQDAVMRIVLGVAGFGVGSVPAVRPVLDWKTPPRNVEWFALGGLVLIVWTIVGVIKPTPMRYLPPAVVSLPVAVFGLIEMAKTVFG